MSRDIEVEEIMNNDSFITGILEPYQPQLPIETLVQEVNKLYHAVEARDYDQRHPEVHQQLPAIWQEMIEKALGNSQSVTWDILDFGCGTGFESEQILNSIPCENISNLTCYDPSPEMLERCRAKISPLFPKATFTSDLSDILSQSISYNLLATNSLLHHLPDPLGTINTVLAKLTPDAIWLAGHEPSSRFYRNPECAEIYEAFLQERSWKKYLDMENYITRFKRLVGAEQDPATAAAKSAFQQGLFKQQPSALAINRIVDFHVAHSFEEASKGRGFDFELMQKDFSSTWQLHWVKSYSFMGGFYDGDLSKKWQRKSQDIAHRFPLDGSNFCMVWRRVS
jgi:SAM-dependent methyltransferase